jgi:NAD-dependent SIR2 family protein deacetylase
VTSIPIDDAENDALNRQKMLNLLANRKLYLFVGAGLSCRVGIPDWKALLTECVEVYREQPQHSPARVRELLRFAERADIELFEDMLNDVAGEEAVIRVLKKYFGEATYHPLHKRLLRLPFCGFVTSNYDRCFEAACAGVHERIDLTGDRWFSFPPRGNESIDVNRLFSGDAFLLHIHGCFCHADSVEIENIILTRSQYQRFYAEATMQEILGRLSKKHLLMMGTSFTDQYFLDALRKYRRPRGINERANMPEWYILHPKEAHNLYPIRDQENYRLHHIYYRDGAEHDGFEDLVAEMSGVIDRHERPLRKMSDSDVEGLGGGQ